MGLTRKALDINLLSLLGPVVDFGRQLTLVLLDFLLETAVWNLAYDGLIRSLGFDNLKRLLASVAFLLLYFMLTFIIAKSTQLINFVIKIVYIFYLNVNIIKIVLHIIIGILA